MSSEPKVGDVVAQKYRLTALIGRGGMGAVYEAEHEELGKRVAIKFLHPELARDAHGTARFKREARAAAATGHRSIIDVYDIGTLPDGSLFLVMELLEGQSLGQRLSAESSLEVSMACYVTAQVASALEAAHRAGIVHRDIKPDNVFLVRTGQALPDIKLLDFGTSRVSDPRSPEEKLTESGVAVGTPYYMAPEQALGERDLDRRVDIYACGVILYECLTGEMPFKADNLYALVRRIINAPVVPPSELRPSLPAGLEQVVQKAMARHRDERYDSAAELIGDLLPYMEDTASSRVSLPDGTEPPGTGTKETVALFAAPTMRASSSEVEGGRPQSGSAAFVRRRPGVAVLLAAVILGGAVLAGYVAFGRNRSGGSSAGGSATAVVSFEDEGRQGDAGASEEAASDGSAADASSTDAASAAEEAGPRYVTISLRGLRAGARVLVNGEPAEGPELRLPRNGRDVEIAVHADGHEPWTYTLVPERNAEIDVVLHPLRVARPGGARRPPPSGEGDEAEPGGAAETTEEQPPPAKTPPRPDGFMREEDFPAPRRAPRAP